MSSAPTAGSPTVTARFAVGIECESRPGSTAWQARVLRIAAVTRPRPGVPDWCQLAEADGVSRFYAGTGRLVVRSTETAGLKDNLAAPSPALYVVLRRDAAAPIGWRLHRVSADPGEAHIHGDVGDDLVEALPMPPAIRDWLGAFVARHHVERAPYKRRRDAAEPAEGERDGESALGRWSRRKRAESAAAAAPPRAGGAALGGAALRQAWAANPAIANHRPLVEYAWDMNAPGYGKLRPTDDVAAMVAALYRPRTSAPAKPGPEPEPEAHAEAEPDASPPGQADAEADPPPADEPEPPLVTRRHGGARPVEPPGSA